MTKELALPQSKSGVSLAEVLIAAALLVVLIGAMIAIISFSNTLVASNVSRENSFTAAEGIADVLITALAKGTTDAPTLESMTGAVFKASEEEFSTAVDAREFTYYHHMDVKGVEGWRIIVRVNGNDGKQAARITAFASDTGGLIG